FLHHSSANSWQWDLHSSGSGNALCILFPTTVWRRVVASDLMDRVDRSKRNIFGFAGKSPPEKFFGGGDVVAGGG
nr:hypothetical protein [Tanacetum cinerariifolium]